MAEHLVVRPASAVELLVMHLMYYLMIELEQHTQIS